MSTIKTSNFSVFLKPIVPEGEDPTDPKFDTIELINADNFSFEVGTKSATLRLRPDITQFRKLLTQDFESLLYLNTLSRVRLNLSGEAGLPLEKVYGEFEDNGVPGQDIELTLQLTGSEFFVI